MKFWVKAVVDNDTQEQLLVEASNTDELVGELSRLLNVNVASVSITDFHGQVADKLAAGEDIITVFVKSASDSPTPVKKRRGGSLENSDLNLSRPSSRSGEMDTLMRQRNSLQREMEEESIPSFTRINSSLGAVTPQGGSRRTSSKSSLLDTAPAIEKLCLSRDSVALLLHRRFGDRYVSDVIGCFVRVLEPAGYFIYQIIDYDKKNSLLLDTVHAKEVRNVDTVSNAPPAKVEVNVWLKKMLSSFRTFPSSGFIEAKYSDIRSALSAANSVFQTHNNNGSPKKVSANPVEERNSDVESTPERRQSRRHTRRATFQFVPTGGLPSTRIVVKTNDNLENIVARVADPSDELSCISLFATRHSNPTGKRERVSDFAGCYISLNSSSEGGIVVDRDVTDKGILLLCPPFEYEDTYYALGQRFRADHSSTYTLDDGSLVQDFLILSGKTQFSLVVSSVVSLPIPLWALNNGFNPVVISPKVVVVDEKIHVFYIVRVRLSEPTVPKGGTPAASPIPSKRLSKERTSIETPSSTHDTNHSPSHEYATVTAVNSANASLDGSLPVSPHRFDERRYSMQESFMLTHVVSPSMDMKTWEIVTDSEPLLQCSSLPLFDVELLPGKEIGLLYCVPTDSTAFVSPLFDKIGGDGDGGPFKLHVFSVTTGSWTLESFKLVGAVKPDKLRDHLRSVSLFTLDENLYLGTVHRSVKAKMLVFLIPLCLEK